MSEEKTNQLFIDRDNLFTKAEPVRDPEDYDSTIFILNRWLGAQSSMTELMAYFSRWLFTLRGRYYHLLYTYFEKMDRPFFKYVKKQTLEEKQRDRVRVIQRQINCDGKEGYMAMLILEKNGVDIDQSFGLTEARKVAQQTERQKEGVKHEKGNRTTKAKGGR